MSPERWGILLLHAGAPVFSHPIAEAGRSSPGTSDDVEIRPQAGRVVGLPLSPHANGGAIADVAT